MALAFHYARTASSRVNWCYLHDTERDIGIAQSILDGQYPADPTYLNEYSWYNPGAGACIATLAKLTGTPPNIIDTHAGAFLNLLLPAFFFLLVAKICGRWTAAIAVAFFIFGNPMQKGHIKDMFMLWACTMSTYSPWLWAPHLGLAPFYLGLATYWKALHNGRVQWFILTGIALGITFLTHTAPALIMGIIILFTIWSSRQHIPDQYSFIKRTTLSLGQGTLIAIIALIVSSPYTLPLLLKYHFHIISEAPNTYRQYYFELKTLGGLLRDLITPANLFATIGLGVVTRTRNDENGYLRARILIIWGVSATLFLAYSYMWQAWPKTLPHPIMPAHHFMISLTGLKVILVAMGMTATGSWTVSKIGQFWPHVAAILQKVDAEQDGFPLINAFILVIVCALYLPRYTNFDEFIVTRDPNSYAVVWNLKKYEPLYQWMLNETKPDDVFLVNDMEVEMRALLPAARKSVGMTLFIFANPYIDVSAIDGDKHDMYNALLSNDKKKTTIFLTLAKKHRLTYIILKDGAGTINENITPFLFHVLRCADVSVIKFKQPS